MKHLFALWVFLLMIVGCDRTNPTAAGASSAMISTSDVAFSETSMLKTVVATDSQLVVMEQDSVAHDSLHHGRMLGSLKTFLGLTDAQFDSVKVFGQTLFETLKEIKKLYRADSISEDSAHVLVKIARDQFIASVRSILTAEQSVKFDVWLKEFWDRHHGEHEGEEHEGNDDHGNGAGEAGDDHGNHGGGNGGGGNSGGGHGSEQEHRGGHH